MPDKISCIQKRLLTECAQRRHGQNLSRCDFSALERPDQLKKVMGGKINEMKSDLSYA